MKHFIDMIQWIATHYQSSMQLLVVLVAVFPFIVIGALSVLLLGMVPSPLLNALEKSDQTHQNFTIQHTALTNSMIQINRVAGEYYALLELHSRESKRKEQLIQYLVLEGCRRDNAKDQGKCERLESTLRELEP